MAELINISHISIMVKCYFASTSGFCDYYNSRLETEKSECFRVSNSSSVILGDMFMKWDILNYGETFICNRFSWVFK